MSGDMGGGRVYIEVVGDAGGLREDIQAKVAAAVEGVSAKVRVEADTSGLREQVDAAARIAEAGQEVRIRVEAETSRLHEEVAAAEAEVDGQLELGLELKAGAAERLRAATTRAVEEAQLGQQIDVGVDAHGGGAALGGAAAGAEEEASAASSAATSTASIGPPSLASAAALAILTGALGAAAGMVGVLAGSVGPLVGILAAIPGAVAVGAGGLGALVGGLFGVGKAVSALGTQQTTGGAQASQYADQQIAAAERVQNAQYQVTIAVRNQRDAQIKAAEDIRRAQQTLANTEYDIARQRISDLHSVAEAEWSLQQAEQASADAIRNLNQAREQATRDLEDYANRAKDAALSQAQAQLDLQAANQASASVLADPNATAQQRAQATLNVQEAQQRLAEATLDAQRATEDNTKAQQKGVDGSQSVVDATRQVTAAHHDQADAIYNLHQAEEQQTHDAVTGAQQLADARQSLRDTYRTTAEQIADSAHAVQMAEQGVADALRAQKQAAASVGGAASAVNKAMAGLSPRAQEFARQIHGIIEGPLKTLRFAAQNALIPGLSHALDIVAGPNGLWPQWTKLVTASGHAIGKVATELAKFATSRATRDFMERLAPTTHKIILSLGDATAHWAAVFRDFASASLPLLRRFASGLDTAAKHLDALLSSKNGRQELRKFFDQVYKTTHAWGQILKNLGTAFGGIIRAALPAGNKLNTTMEHASAHFSKWVNSIGGQNKLKHYFDEAEPILVAIGRAISSLFKALAGAGNDPKWAALFQALADAGPAIKKWVDALGGGAASIILGLAGGLLELLKVLAPFAPVLGPILVALFAAAKIIAVVTKVVEFLTPVIEGLVTVVETLGTVLTFLAANPVVLIIAAVVALGVGLYELYKHWAPFRHIVDAIGHFLKDVFLGILHAVGDVIGWLGDHVKLVATVALPLLLGPLGLVIDAFLHWHEILGVLKTVFSDVVGFVTALPGRIFSAFGSFASDVKDFFKKVWTRGYDATKTVIHDVVDFVKGLPGKVWHALSSFGHDLYDHAKKWFVRLGDAEREVIVDVVKWIGGLPGKIWNALKDLGTSMYNHAKSWFGRLWTGLKWEWTTVIGWIGGLGTHIWNTLKSLPTEMWNFGVKLIEELGKGILHAVENAGGSLANGLKKAGEKVVGFLNPFGDTLEGPMSSSGVGGPDKMGVRLMGELGKGILTGRRHVERALAVVAGDVGRSVGSAHPRVGYAASTVASAAGGLQEHEGGAAGVIYQFADGAIQVYNPAPEPAGTSVAARVRRMSIMHTPPPRASVRRPAR